MPNTDYYQVVLQSGLLTRILDLSETGVVTSRLLVDRTEWLDAGKEFKLSLRYRTSDKPPAGMQGSEDSIIETTATFGKTDELAVSDTGEWKADDTNWSDALLIDGSAESQLYPRSKKVTTEIQENGIERWNVELTDWEDPTFSQVRIILRYELFPHHSAIRKKLIVHNESANWVKIDEFMIDHLLLVNCHPATEYTPSGRGAQSSILALENTDHTQGIILGSEIPSALRYVDGTGAMGYNSDYFEWVLGPGEQFESEGTFYYGCAGETWDTGAGLSKPVDRAIEREFQSFLRHELHLARAPIERIAPLWCTWSNFGPNIDQPIILELADLAVQAGFQTMQIDDGWQRGRLGTEPDLALFPDFKGMCASIKASGLELGLWVSTFRDEQSKDLRDIPDGLSVPWLKRLGGYGMSFTSPWRDYYADDLVSLSQEYGVSYFKQDFTNIKFGDIGQGHESRTRKESLLRGLRGLLAAQDRIRAGSPGITLEITHEIYWGTPGVPCDLAALQHADTYHIPPNDYSGVGHWKERYREDWDYDPEQLSQQLIAGCYQARVQLYAHRGLPLQCIEYYGAATVNVRGSLTTQIQDRQICSWLMGAPQLFAGDLASLTEENLNHYKQRFDLLRRLQMEYDIYRNFQWSGVPEPTDKDWHWWGKINANGEGVVVALRGDVESESCAIYIPWVNPEFTYQVTLLFTDGEVGRLTGRELQAGACVLSLPIYGQEIIELKIC
ncbi:alpha-galactosidase [Paenibacillus qinlingensis]|uniref:alpha-galactosidase n=1 Tax=Paenibacillus qinlingensis TaxID=1837343 RepID=UPI001566AA50|nr:hypothetical protein [Paenibacillus qinlingensis]NQX59357.1 hypothetical protein [Paenibacillus qinlingensis]